MTIGLVGRKLGMTRVFTEAGDSIPVSVVEILPNNVTQIKTLARDGYSAVQVTTGTKKAKHLTKAESGHFAASGVAPGLGLWEFCVDNASVVQVGESLTLDRFKVGDIVDVTGTSKGKGFAGGVKRHNFRMQNATHGNSLSHRVLGSTGQNQTPRRVFKGKKMPGQMGNVRSTMQNIEIVRVDTGRQVLLIKGAIPGAPGGTVIVKAAVKVQQNAAATAA